MKIAVIGAGAMGSIYGAHLSLANEVCMVDTNAAIVEKINQEGLKIEENGTVNVYHPRAVTDTSKESPADVVLLFVKSIFSRAALSSNAALFGKDTILMTLQNGAGHEDILKEYVSENRIVIGTTEDNGMILEPGFVRRGGEGKTNIGMVVEDCEEILPRLKEAFEKGGFKVAVRENIQQLIWDKLFTNVSLSAVTGILQVDMGYISENESAWNMTKSLIHEAVMTAKAAGLDFDEEVLCDRVWNTSHNNPKGCTSIRADLRDGRKTEVDTISGAVVRAAEKLHVDVPTHRFVVNMVHAMEGKGERK